MDLNTCPSNISFQLLTVIKTQENKLHIELSSVKEKHFTRLLLSLTTLLFIILGIATASPPVICFSAGNIDQIIIFIIAIVLSPIKLKLIVILIAIAYFVLAAPEISLSIKIIMKQNIFLGIGLITLTILLFYLDFIKITKYKLKAKDIIKIILNILQKAVTRLFIFY